MNRPSAVPLASDRARWSPSARKVRFLVYLAILLGIAAWKFLPRSWTPALTLETAHFNIASTATRAQTEEVGRLVEVLYSAYSNQFSALPGFRQHHAPLRLRLYRDRAELRRVNLNLGWAEAFYRKPVCHAYYSAGEINPFHWMLHEVVHQLNEEVAHLRLERWLDEGVAEYFSTSQINADRLALGRLDYNTYPVGCLDQLATNPELKINHENGSVIPLRAILAGCGGPSLNRHFNLYYLHWCTLAHFLFERGTPRDEILGLLREGGTLESFERRVGPVEQIQTNWHAYVRQIKEGIWRPKTRTESRGLSQEK